MQQRHSTSALVTAVFALAGAFCFIGCETAQQPHSRATPLGKPAERIVQVAVPSESAVSIPPIAPAQSVPVETAPPAAPIIPAPAQLPQVDGEWLDLAKWCEGYGLATPAHGIASPPKWELQVPDGMIEILPGSRFVHWNGMLVSLGFGPRPCKSGLQMHGLDIEKNIKPLASPFYFRGPEKVVVLDPGHGGINAGTRSPQTSALEKDLTLDWALRVKRLLVGSGWTVLLTRTNDVDLTLVQRVALADEIHPDLFVSLHFNGMEAASKSHDEAGIETYCLTPAGMPSNITREFEDDPLKIFPNNQFDAENLQWAVRFHRQILSATGAHDRGVRRARFMGVVREQRRPAVLIEGGYLSNLHEAKLLSDGSYREKLAWAVASAITKQ